MEGLFRGTPSPSTAADYTLAIEVLIEYIMFGTLSVPTCWACLQKEKAHVVASVCLCYDNDLGTPSAVRFCQVPLGKLFLKVRLYPFLIAMFFLLSAQIVIVRVYGFSKLVLKSLGRQEVWE